MLGILFKLFIYKLFFIIDFLVMRSICTIYTYTYTERQGKKPEER